MKKLELGLSADGKLPIVADHNRPTRKTIDIRESSPDETQVMREDTDRLVRATWDIHLKKARDSIPERFNWVTVLARDASREFVVTDSFARYLPWLTPHHVRMLFDAWRSKKNILISGPVGTGKTSLIVLLARWFEALAGFDARAVVMQREKCEAWERADDYERSRFVAASNDIAKIETLLHGSADVERDELLARLSAARRAQGARVRTPAPMAPEELRDVQNARGLRFVWSKNLLTPDMREPDAKAVRAAENASILLLDEVAEELGRAPVGSGIMAQRSPALEGVIKYRWSANKPFYATTKFKPEELDARYDGGAFRRLVESASCACVIDLCEDIWAGEFIRERAKKKANGVKR